MAATPAAPAKAPAFSCGDVSEIPNSDCTALEALYNATNGNRWLDKSNWLSTTKPCTWYGVTCSAGRGPSCGSNRTS
ncbi:MAG: hypothetical protein R2867_33445 [Caldilineaceae bacterium]